MKTPVLEFVRGKSRWFVAIGVLLLLDIISFSLISFHQSPVLERRKSAWTEQRKRLDAMTRGDTTFADYSKAKRDLEKIAAMIPSRRNFPALLGEIVKSSSLCGVAVDSISYKPSHIRERNLLAYGITMSVTGRYASLRCFLYQVQTMRELVAVDGLSFSNQDPYVEKVTMELKMTAYLRDGS